MTSAAREFKGRHLLAIMLGFFAVIISVNLTMAWFAGSSWTGFVVRNSYIASQEFNGKVAAARAQQSLGWSASLGMEAGTASLSLWDRGGQTIALEAATLEFKSPAGDGADRTVMLAGDSGRFQARLDLGDGIWVVVVKARTAAGLDWVDTRRIHLRNGTIK